MSLDLISKGIIKSTIGRTIPTIPTFENGKKKGEMINLLSNDYLGLSKNKNIISASILATKKFGCSSSGSRLMGGGGNFYLEAEEVISKFFGYEAATMFGSGFMANFGILGTFISKKDTVFFDKHCHASIVEGIMASGAKWFRFAHNSAKSLESLIEKKPASKDGRIFVVTESVFSMDGTIAPLKKIKDLCTLHNALLIVDEAHAIGIFGKGRGVCHSLGIMPDMTMVAFGKALGSCGAAYLSSKITKQAIIQSCKTFIFSTAMPPATVGAIQEGFKILSENDTYGEKLLNLASLFHKKLVNNLKSKKEVIKIIEEGDFLKILERSSNNCIAEIPKFESQIIPIITPDQGILTKIVDDLQKSGYFIKWVGYPTVQKGRERVRISICLFHGKNKLIRLSNLIANLLENAAIDFQKSGKCKV